MGGVPTLAICPPTGEAPTVICHLVVTRAGSTKVLLVKDGVSLRLPTVEIPRVGETRTASYAVDKTELGRTDGLSLSGLHRGKRSLFLRNTLLRARST